MLLVYGFCRRRKSTSVMLSNLRFLIRRTLNHIKSCPRNTRRRSEYFTRGIGTDTAVRFTRNLALHNIRPYEREHRLFRIPWDLRLRPWTFTGRPGWGDRESISGSVTGILLWSCSLHFTWHPRDLVGSSQRRLFSLLYFLIESITYEEMRRGWWSQVSTFYLLFFTCFIYCIYRYVDRKVTQPRQHRVQNRDIRRLWCLKDVLKTSYISILDFMLFGKGRIRIFWDNEGKSDLKYIFAEKRHTCGLFVYIEKYYSSDKKMEFN